MAIDPEDEDEDPEWETVVEWPESTNLTLNAGRVNLKDQTVAVRDLLEATIISIINYLGLVDAYPNLTQKGRVIKEALLFAAKEKLPEATDWIKKD